LKTEEIEILKKIKKLALEIEGVAADGKFPEDRLAQLFLLLSSLSHSLHPEYRKIAEIQDHLHPGMTLRHFMNFMIPVERQLGQSVREDEFLITKEDRPDRNLQRFPLIFVLENIRSAFNVGSIYRLADGVGVSEIHLCGYTPRPDPKTALGTEDIVETKIWHSLADALQSLQDREFAVFALETAKSATSLFHWQVHGPTALVVGNERFGLEASQLVKMDGVLELPMSGRKNSLNVASALAVAAFEWKRQWLELESPRK
jgi:tRNA(Leu) C34 or U34 (ribose-2'-O)-methylase TrmL